MGYSFFKKHKYNMARTPGGSSKLEEAVYQRLLLREKAGEITDISRQSSVVLGTETVENAITGKKRVRTIRWKVDFSFLIVKPEEQVWAEAKGIETKTYRKQLRLWREGAGPGKLEIWKGDWHRPKIVEIVDPKKGRDAQ